MEVAIYANHAEPEIAAIAGKFTADGGRVYWRSPTHYTAGESEKMDLVLTAPNHPHAEQIAKDHEARGVKCESTAAHVAKVPQPSKNDEKPQRKA